MPDYPINKLSSVAERFFKANKKDRFNLHMNRIYDAKEVAIEKKQDFFDGIILEGIETNAINTPDSSTSLANITTPNIVTDAETGEEYIEVKIRCLGKFSPTQSLKNPLEVIVLNPQEAIFYANIHPRALMPIGMFFSKPIRFRSHVKIQKKNGTFYIIDVSPTMEQIPLQNMDLTTNFNFASPGFLLAAGGGFSDQGGIIIPSTPLNQKKVPDTVFPCKPERLVTSLLGIRGRPATAKDIKNGTTGKRSWHGGIDLGTPMNDPIYSIADGEVIFSSKPGAPNKGAGYFIKIKHTGLKRVDGSAFTCVTKYMHNNRNLVKKGDKVTRGQQIALAGTTGASTGPHLHFEVRDKSPRGAAGGLYYEPLWLFDWYANGIKPRTHHEKNFLERTKSVAINGGHLPRPNVI